MDYLSVYNAHGMACDTRACVLCFFIGNHVRPLPFLSFPGLFWYCTYNLCLYRGKPPPPALFTKCVTGCAVGLLQRQQHDRR